MQIIRAMAAASCLLLAAMTPALAGSETAQCTPRAFDGHTYTVCISDPATTDFKLFLNKPDGSAYARLEALPAEGLLFATNAGMFTPEYAPAGLYVENGIARKALNTRKSGYGNFHLQPNGVFWVQDGKATVSTTAEFARLNPSPDIATQSGPMLVIAGALHPRFDDDGPSRNIRNGIGVTADGRVAVAISEDAVSFGAFAKLFRDALQCPNALYLDGSVSRLLVNGDKRDTFGPPLGPMLGVYRKAD